MPPPWPCSLRPIPANREQRERVRHLGMLGHRLRCVEQPSRTLPIRTIPGQCPLERGSMCLGRAQEAALQHGLSGELCGPGHNEKHCSEAKGLGFGKWSIRDLGVTSRASEQKCT